MTTRNLNSCEYSVGSADTKKNVPYIDEVQFCAVHEPQKTENWQILKENFVLRRNLEQEKMKIKKDRQKLRGKYDTLSKDLSKVYSEPTKTPEDEKKKQEKIANIVKEMNKVREQIFLLNDEISKKNKEIININEKIVKQTEVIKKEEIDNLRASEENQTRKKEQIGYLKSMLNAV